VSEKDIKIETLSSEKTGIWDAYVHTHPKATLYHLSGWRNVIRKTYGHKSYYLMATSSYQRSEIGGQKSAPHLSCSELSADSHQQDCVSNPIVGILPMFHLKHFVFGNNLVSMPFFDFAGILADSPEVEAALLHEAINLSEDLNADTIELRQTHSLSCLDDRDFALSFELRAMSSSVLTHKVRMLLELPESSDSLMSSFRSKLRSQIRKPEKEGLRAKIGASDLLDDFYAVFLVNMRDLGSPVHSRRLLSSVLAEFKESARVIIVYLESEPVACGMAIGFKDILMNPWASALRRFGRLSPNMLLYWAMLEYACDNGYSLFDFGRSTPGEGTYRFKEQWGAKPRPLHWIYLSSNEKSLPSGEDEKSRFDIAIQYWQKLPVPVTRIFGPMIRKHIGL